MHPKITEADIVDMLIGGRSAEEVERIKTAIAHDPKLAAAYDDWSQVIPFIYEKTKQARETSKTVRKYVGDRLAYEFPIIYTPSVPWNEEKISNIGLAALRIYTAFSRNWLRVTLASCTAAIVAVVSVYFLVLQGDERSITDRSRHAEITSKFAVSEVLKTIHPKEKNALQSVPEWDENGSGKAFVTLPDQVKISIEKNADIQIKSKELCQSGGTVYYDVPEGKAELFCIRIPQGVVLTMGNAAVYEISVIPGKSSLLQVGHGSVRIVGERQESVVQAGESAYIHRDSITIVPRAVPEHQ